MRVAPHSGQVFIDIGFSLLITSMQNSNKLVAAFIYRIVSEEVDKELAASEKRRKDFKNGFAQVFAEADAAVPPPPPDPNAPPATPTPGAPEGAPAGDPNTPATPGADPALGGAGGAPGADGAVDPDAPADGEEGGDPAAAGGGDGFGGFGGGGGGGGGGGDDGMDSPEGAEGDTDTEEPEEKPEGDPIQAMVSGAQELLDQTQDPNLILKSLKGQIQTLFQEPEHALGLIKALYDTQDSILQAVAQRLYLFIKTARPR